MKRTLATLALLRAFVLCSLRAPGSPGGAVVLTCRDDVILKRSYGLAGIEHGTPITPVTRFELASVLGGQRTWLRSRI